MATSVLTDHHQTTNPSSLQSSLRAGQDHQTNHRRSSTGRRKTKGEKIKKQPQRGMGVEKLERARLQKRWEKLTEINAAAANHGGFTIINPAAAASAFSDPAFFGGAAASVLPVHLSKMAAGYGAPIAGQMGFNPNPNQTSYLGFHGQTTSFVIPSNYKELSSNSSSPNVVLNCYSQHCNSCRKKKKVMTRISEMNMMQSCDYVGDYGFLGLNIGDNNNTPQNITNSQETQQYCQKGTKAPPFVPHQLGGYSVGNSKQGVDVVAVHRRGPTSSVGVVMEYEFFPSDHKTTFCRSTDDDDDQLVNVKMVGSSETMATNSSSYCSSSTMAAGFDASSHVDLSLKLSI